MDTFRDVIGKIRKVEYQCARPLHKIGMPIFSKAMHDRIHKRNIGSFYQDIGMTTPMYHTGRHYFIFNAEEKGILTMDYGYYVLELLNPHGRFGVMYDLIYSEVELLADLFGSAIEYRLDPKGGWKYQSSGLNIN